MLFQDIWSLLGDNASQLRTVAGFLTFCVAIISAFIAVWAIRANKRLAKERSTLDMLTRIELDQDYIRRRRIFNEVVTSTDPSLTRSLIKLSRTARRDRETRIPKIEAIRVVLDIYELLGIAMANKTLDSRVYHTWFRGSLTGDWNLIRGFVRHLRKEYENPRIYVHFEWLAVQWGGKPTKLYAAHSKSFAGLNKLWRHKKRPPHIPLDVDLKNY